MVTDDPALRPLAGLRVLEFASFVAGPSGGMTLGQLGADVIRLDPIGGAADYGRWPLSQRTGRSLYWTALNKGKRSISIDVRSAEGRELIVALATAPGPDAGIVVDNNVGRSWLSYEALSKRRADLIQVHIDGYADGRAAVDYTVNPDVGVANMTGPADSAAPVNHVLPAWDLLAGMTATTGLLAALHRRARTGEGAFLRIALADVAYASVANLGWLAEADELGTARPRHGNHVYGSFGVDFETSDQARVMVVALTVRHWDALRTVTDTGKVFDALEETLGADFRAEADRYRYREIITATLRPWFAARPFAEVDRVLSEAGVLYSRFRTVHEVVTAYRAEGGPEILGEVDQPGIGPVLSARSPLRAGAEYGEYATAPDLGEHTDEVLAQVLGLADTELGRLHDAGVIAGSARSH
ncbi:CoA transferase [Nocardia macrotermitis]|uniref:2-methylfumaryl-CoA isomerase n=1 Tax=Nocardia macrotermitis TaxID=2585198 RepID=A0A7K0D7P3_9NOCA|nr:CoA transferase [Nocardia macrotermitis]MQY21795.1 2-methylfumaryl-CoA isomerase [Nocardia macrotermitis]